MTAKTIPDPTAASPQIFSYTRPAGGGSPGRMTDSYVIFGAVSDSGSIAATAAVSTLIDTLIQASISYTPAANDAIEVTIDRIALNLHIQVHQVNADLDAQFRQGSFTNAMRTAAQNVITQGLADGLKTAMGF